MSNNSHQMTSISFKLQIEMLSDWHIGSGSGQSGNIDALVKRDHHDLPYLPAKTLTGILRDACELVAQGLDNNNNNGIWQQWVNYLFGDQPSDPDRPLELSLNEPIPAALSIRPAYFPDELVEVIKSKDKLISQQLKQAITFTKPSIKIDSLSGCAEQDCLRLEEQVRMGTILTADCTLDLPDNEDQQKTAYFLLLAGVKMVERLGGNRRRGSGKCSLSILESNHNKLSLKKDFNLNQAIEWIRQSTQIANVPSNNSEEIEEITDDLASQTTNQSQTEQPINDTWLTTPLSITLETPLIIAKRTVGNVVETLDYIPGTHLLRLVARKLGKLGINLRDAITKGDLVVTNATLAIEGEKSQPVPFCLFYEKLTGGLDKLNEGGKVYNRLQEEEPDGEQLKSHRSGYLIQPESSLYPISKTVNLMLGTHNTIQDQYQRPTQEVGGVYSYQAMQTGTKLIAELRLTKSLADNLAKKDAQWWKKLGGIDRIGQSKKDDYGKISIIVEYEPKLFKKQVKNNNKLYVWLLSDLLLRNKQLRPTTDINDLAEELSNKLGVTLTKINDNNSGLLTLIARQNRLESWQVSWGLPRPSLVGLGAGSCIIFNLKESLTAEHLKKLAEIEAKGIGERTAEGYGQICLNHPLLTKPFSEFQKDDSESLNIPQNSSQFINKNDMSFKYAHLIELSAWREEINRQAMILASKKDKRQEIMGITLKNGESKPSISQLGALRSVISHLRSPEDSSKIISWIESVQNNKSRKEKWNKESFTKLTELMDNRSKIWEYFKIFDDLILTENAKIELRNKLWAETVRTLISACILAHKRDLEKELSSQLNEP